MAPNIAKNKKSLALLLLLGLTSSSFALQLRPILDNGTAKAYVSIQGETRIAVENDRILDVKGPDGAYVRTNDNTQGTVFIQPTVAFQKKPFTLFITTEQNHYYLLRIIPRDQNSDNILLQPAGVINPLAAHWEQSSPYTVALTQLLQDMVNRTSPEGYAVDPVRKTKKQYLGSVAVIKLTRIYSGAHLQGDIYCVKNRTGNDLHLTEREFYQPGDRAIALSNLVVAPGGQTWLYKVRNHG